MNPEDILRFAQRARQRGWSTEQINTRLQELDVPYSSLADVQRAATQSQATARRDASAAPGPAPPPDKSAFAGMDRAGRLFGEALTAGGLDEAAGALRGTVHAAGALVPGGESPGEAFRRAYDEEVRASRQRLQKAQEGAGLGTKALAYGGGILAGPALPIRAVGAATKSSRFLAPALSGAATGAAEGAAAGILSEDPDPELSAKESVSKRLEAAPGSAAVGAAAGGILGPAVAGRAASKAKPTAGARLGKATRGESGLSGRASKVTRDVAEQQSRISRELYKPLEELGELESPAVRRALQEDDVAPVVEDLFPKIAEGERNPTFLELQKIKKRLEGLRDRAVRSGDSFELDKYGRAADEVVEAMGEAIPDRFPQAQRAWRIEAGRLRALEKGRKLWSKTADDVQEAFRKLETDAERRAFREGLATEFAAKVEKLTEPKATLRRIQNSPQTRSKLEILFGSKERLNRFTREVLGEERLRNRAHLYERLKRWIPIAAIGGGSAGVGGGILDVF